ncbi:MAG: glycosyltransferase family 2 protein [Candidatus Methanospirareceae archaeon]
MGHNFSHVRKVSISVGIAAHNEEANIGRLLQNLMEQPLEDYMELEKIIVVTSGCTDRTEEIVEEFKRRDEKGRIRHIREEERRGKSSAVNIVLKNAQDEDILVMLSADNLPEKGSLCDIIKPLVEDSDIGAVSGHPVPVNDRATLFGFISHLIWDLHYVLSLSGDTKLTGEFYAVRPRLVEEIPPVVNDDLYIEWMVKEQGYKIRHSDAVSYMKGPETLRDFLRQRIRVHIGHYQVARMTGYVPQTVKIWDIIKGLRRFVEMRRLHFLAVAIFLEMSARALAFLLFHLNKIPYRWACAETTKYLNF